MRGAGFDVRVPPGGVFGLLFAVLDGWLDMNMVEQGRQIGLGQLHALRTQPRTELIGFCADVVEERRRCPRLEEIRLHTRDRIASAPHVQLGGVAVDRKSTRLNSSHVAISYAGFCLK